ncbi:hypothetical protein ACLKA7_000397 [Drosophila subpalustris]
MLPPLRRHTAANANDYPPLASDNDDDDDVDGDCDDDARVGGTASVAPSSIQLLSTQRCQSKNLKTAGTMRAIKLPNEKLHTREFDFNMRNKYNDVGSDASSAAAQLKLLGRQ